MMDELTPAEFDELLAFEFLEGQGMQPLQHTVAIGLSIIAKCLGADVQWWQLIPGMQDPTPTASPDQAAAMFRAIAGGKR